MMYRIYQLPISNNNIFRPFRADRTINIDDYVCVFFGEKAGVIGTEEDQANFCEKLFSEFNLARPKNFGGHSMSVSDVVELFDDDGEGHEASYYCDVCGFKKISLQNN